MASPQGDRAKPKGILRNSIKPPKDNEFEMFKVPKGLGESRGVVIAIEETGSSTFILSTPPKTHIPRIPTPEAPAKPDASKRSEPVGEGHDQRSIMPLNALPPPPLRSRATSPAGSRSPSRSHASSPTLVRSASHASSGSYSPVMRSMFPRYDPKVPLARQHYYPTNESNRGSANVRLEVPGASTYSTSMYSQGGNSNTNSFRANEGNTNVMSNRTPNWPLQSPENSVLTPTLSTPEELLDLWSVANGQSSLEAAEIYTLGLSCPSLTLTQEIISLTSSTSQPLYQLRADGTTLRISRLHPLNPLTSIPISASEISTLTHNNPIVSTIFPKFAELMALDQSSSIAVDHRLDRHASADLQAEALDRAYRQEASTLFWDTDSERYYLIHPTLSPGNNPATFAIESTPAEIKFFTPSDPPVPILSLSFASLVITLHTKPLLHLQSLYILDTLLTTLLTLLLHLHRSSPSPSPLAQAIPALSPAYPPPPPLKSPSHPSPSLSHPPSQPTPPTFFSLLKFPKRSKRKSKTPHDEESTTTAPPPQPKQHPSPPPNLHLSLPSPSPSLSSSPSGTIKPSTYDLPTDPPLEKPPRITRAVLRLLYWAFSVVVWALGLGVRVLAKTIVAMGRCVARL